MNYRHAYHAGNFADVLKHAVLALVIEHLKLKPSPFRVIDTHAGAGVYDLAGGEAAKTGEWRDGIGRLAGPGAEHLPGEVAVILEPYLQAIAACNPRGEIRSYPGSPRLALALMRPGDRLLANELQPDDAQDLACALAGDARASVLRLDGWLALKSQLPPKERRGAILIDPPFEETDELDRILRGLRDAHRRFATGTYLIWYPIKSRKPVAAFHRALKDAAYSKVLAGELLVRSMRNSDTLNGCGLIVINPPHTLHGKLETLLPFLAERLARDDETGSELHWIDADH
jgi:23S rRNA (adenine2030-N6)-methyltransferase